MLQMLGTVVEFAQKCDARQSNSDMTVTQLAGLFVNMARSVSGHTDQYKTQQSELQNDYNTERKTTGKNVLDKHAQATEILKDVLPQMQKKAGGLLNKESLQMLERHIDHLEFAFENAVLDDAASLNATDKDIQCLKNLLSDLKSQKQDLKNNPKYAPLSRGLMGGLKNTLFISAKSLVLAGAVVAVAGAAITSAIEALDKAIPFDDSHFNNHNHNLYGHNSWRLSPVGFGPYGGGCGLGLVGGYGGGGSYGGGYGDGSC